MKPLLNNWLTIRSRTTTSIQSAHNNQSIGNLEHLPGTRGSQSVGRLLMQIYGIEWRATATVDHIQISSLLCGWPRYQVENGRRKGRWMEAPVILQVDNNNNNWKEIEDLNAFQYSEVSQRSRGRGIEAQFARVFFAIERCAHLL